MTLFQKRLILLTLLLGLLLITGCTTEELIEGAPLEEVPPEESAVFSLKAEDVEKIVFENLKIGIVTETENERDIAWTINKLNGFRCIRKQKKTKTMLGYEYRIAVYLKNPPSPEQSYRNVVFGQSCILTDGYFYFSADENYFSEKWMQQWEERLQELVSNE